MREALQRCRELSFAVSDPGLPAGILLASNGLLLAGGALLAAVLLLSVCRWPRSQVCRTRYGNVVACLFLGSVGGFLVVRARLIYFFDYLDLATAADLALRGDPERYRKFCQLTVAADFGFLIQVLSVLMSVAGAVLLVAALLGLAWKRRLAHRLLHAACCAAYGLFLFFLYVLYRGVNLGHAADVFGSARDVTTSRVLTQAVPLVAPFAVLLAVVAVVHVWYWRRPVLELFRAGAARPAPGDRLIESVRTHGEDPRYRKSVLNSMLLHLLVLLVIPWLAGLVGCLGDRDQQQGGGDPLTALIKRVQPKQPKQKKQPRYILDPRSPVLWRQPNIDDSPMLQEVDRETTVPYTHGEAFRLGGLIGGRAKGGLGENGGAGGWPDGSPNGAVCFIRLRYDGRNWDDGMAEWQRADQNFLEYFHRVTKLRVARGGEAHAASLLKGYRKGHAPPFVFMCGDAGISMSGRDEKALGEYLRDGGLLFADCGGAQWDAAFRSFIARVLPEKKLDLIPDDDPIFRLPCEFPSGAPPLWHHGGTRALGMKHGDRWCVFYHPGDLHDAWKTGNAGLRQDQADQAFELGVNVVYYSVTHYLHATRKYRIK